MRAKTRPPFLDGGFGLPLDFAVNFPRYTGADSRYQVAAIPLWRQLVGGRRVVATRTISFAEEGEDAYSTWSGSVTATFRLSATLKFLATCARGVCPDQSAAVLLQSGISTSATGVNPTTNAAGSFTRTDKASGHVTTGLYHFDNSAFLALGGDSLVRDGQALKHAAQFSWQSYLASPLPSGSSPQTYWNFTAALCSGTVQRWLDLGGLNVLGYYHGNASALFSSLVPRSILGVPGQLGMYVVNANSSADRLVVNGTRTTSTGTITTGLSLTWEWAS